MENGIKKIFKLQIAMDLKHLGNELMYTEDNLEKKGFKVFCFIKTDKLLKDLTNLTRK